MIFDWTTNCDPTCVPSPQPVIASCNCQDNIRELSVIYSGTPGANILAFYDSGRLDTIGVFNNVQPGDTLTIASASAGNTRFGADAFFSVNGAANILVASNCAGASVGAVSGPFTTAGWVDGDGQTCFSGAPSKVQEEPVATSGQSGASAMDMGIMTLSAHPNPFREATTVRFTVPEADRVTVRVFNMAGKEVAVLFDGDVMGGLTYDIEWRAENVSDGIYTAKLLTNSPARTLNVSCQMPMLPLSRTFLLKSRQAGRCSAFGLRE